MTVRLYRLGDPRDCSFAQASRLGTWYPNPGPGICPECTASRQKRVPPLVIEWEPGSDVIGDFTWPGFGDEIVVTQRVREALEGRFRGFEFLPIQMHQDPKLVRPERVTKRTKPRIWLPYQGPPLWDLQAPAWCKLDLEKSHVTVEKVCRTCGTTYHKFPPGRTRHLVVDPASWGGQHAFRLREVGLLTVSEEVKQFIETERFTNVGFWPEGEIPV